MILSFYFFEWYVVNPILCILNIISLKLVAAGIAEVLDPKGLKKGMNKAGDTKGLTQEENDKNIERANRLMTN
jgi:hypothetical protein